MKKLKNNKGFTLVELLAVIVVLAIVMGIAAVAITSVLNNTRKSTFATNAELFIDGARDLVNASDMNSMLGATGDKYAPTCTSGAKTYIPVLAVNLESGGETSPYNNGYLKGTIKTPSSTTIPTYTPEGASEAVTASYVLVEIDDLTNCTYKYSIYLSDGVYAVGTASQPVPENQITPDKVLPVSGS